MATPTKQNAINTNSTKTISAMSIEPALDVDAPCAQGSDNCAMVTFDSGSYTLAVMITNSAPAPDFKDSETVSCDPEKSLDNTRSVPAPATLPPSILLTSAALGAAATNSILGSKMWGPELQILGLPFNLSPAALPPWPVIITRGTLIQQWAASFEVIETVGVGVPGIDDIITMLQASSNPAAAALAVLLSLLGPFGTLTDAMIKSITDILGDVLSPPTIHAQLIHAKPADSSIDALFQADWAVVDDINLGEIPLVSAFSVFHAEHKLEVPYTIAPGDYLLIRYYIDSNIVAEAYGFHAGANVVIC